MYFATLILNYRIGVRGVATGRLVYRVFLSGSRSERINTRKCSFEWRKKIINSEKKGGNSHTMNVIHCTRRAVVRFSVSSIGGSVVECSPATRATRVRFPANADNFFQFFAFFYNYTTVIVP